MTNSINTNTVEYLYTSPEDKYSLFPNIIAANGDAAGVQAAESSTVKINKVMIGAGLMPAFTQ